MYVCPVIKGPHRINNALIQYLTGFGQDTPFLLVHCYEGNLSDKLVI